MNNPSKKPDDKQEKEYKKRILDELLNQAHLIFNKLEDAANKHIQHVFVVNAGGAAAVLAFLGAKPGSSFAVWPLLIFVSGVIACGINLLASYYTYKGMFDDAWNQRKKYEETGKLTKAKKPEKSISYRIANWTGFFAHGCIILGIIVGGVTYLNSGNTNIESSKVNIKCSHSQENPEKALKSEETRNGS